MSRQKEPEGQSHPIQSLTRGNWTDSDLAAMEGILGSRGVLSDPTDIERYAVDWTGTYAGKPPFVLRPNGTEEVAAILRYASAHGLALVPQSGNTGLVGGSVPADREVVLSLDRMQRVLALDLDVPALVCEAGAILEDLQMLAEGQGFSMPIDLGSRGSCRAGGLAATHAGGIRLVRDGPLGASILGLEVVLADGRILSSLRTLRKDNTGYRWRDLFIGSEGTLGVITAVSFLLRPQPQARRTALIPVARMDDVAPAIRVLRKGLGTSIGALELIGRSAADLVARELPELRPLPALGAYQLLVEVEGRDAVRLEEDLARVVGDLPAAGLGPIVEDALLAQGDAESRALWSVRESITEAIRKTGSSRKFDVSLPPRAYATVVDALQEELDARWPTLTLLTFGHAADGNLHLNVVGPRPPEGWEAVDDALYEKVIQANGSISAEHGIGLLKRPHLSQMRTPAELAFMWDLKRLLDPQGILNPGKVLPPESMDSHGDR